MLRWYDRLTNWLFSMPTYKPIVIIRIGAITTIEGSPSVMSKVTLTDLEKVVLPPIVVLDAMGNPAPIDGKPTWSVSDPNLLTVIPTDDGLGAQVVTVGPLGVGQVVVTVDADLGSGFEPINGTLDVEVIGSKAATIVVNAGTPEPR